MPKRTFIKVKRGLLDPKHRDRMGNAVWLYLYILDRCDWETGKVLQWIDEAEAEVLDMPLPTLRFQRKQLQDKGYISIKQKQHCQQIAVSNWDNPKAGDKPIVVEGDNEGYNEGDNQGDKIKVEGNNEGNNEGMRQIITPTYSSDIRYQIKDNMIDNVLIPEPLRTDNFIKVWIEWLQYRFAAKKKLTAFTQIRQLALLSKYPPDTAIAIINQSITNGWQGLFPLKEPAVKQPASLLRPEPYSPPVGRQ